ncbi:MAG: 50S ribosomal protein L32 [Bdellovibrionales bacterium]
MAVPKGKVSKSKRNQRRAHDALTVTNWVEDSNTGEPVRRHHIDLKTGMYKGKQVIDVQD